VYRPFFGHLGRRSRIISPMLLRNPHNIYVGHHVQIRNGARLETVTQRCGVAFEPKVTIGNYTAIEQGFHLTCAERVEIGNHVSITEYVGIFDIWHPYEDTGVPIMDQPLKTSPVRIGDGSFIGFGAVIQPGVTIGRNCLVGANSVVTKSIPDFCVAVGIPAKVIRRYDQTARQWEKVP
jgi:acetyltransferase-like isoleucine patch superfamily enzyme